MFSEIEATKLGFVNGPVDVFATQGARDDGRAFLLRDSGHDRRANDAADISRRSDVAEMNGILHRPVTLP